jgi:hypothetical protein
MFGSAGKLFKQAAWNLWPDLDRPKGQPLALMWIREQPRALLLDLIDRHLVKSLINIANDLNSFAACALHSCPCFEQLAT